MWFKVDDKLAFHPKTIAAGNAAMGLWVRAGSWSASLLTDGYVPADIARSLGARPADAEALMATGLWVPAANGYHFHDWHAYQPSADDARLTQDAAGRANHVRWHVKRGVVNPGCKYCRERPDRSG